MKFFLIESINKFVTLEFFYIFGIDQWAIRMIYLKSHKWLFCFSLIFKWRTKKWLSCQTGINSFFFENGSHIWFCWITIHSWIRESRSGNPENETKSLLNHCAKLKIFVHFSWRRPLLFMANFFQFWQGFFFLKRRENEWIRNHLVWIFWICWIFFVFFLRKLDLQNSHLEWMLLQSLEQVVNL